MNKIDFTIMYALLSFTMLFYSCADNSKKTVADSKLGKIDVEIPASLKDKPEVVAYIHDMNKVADDYAMMIDQVLSDFKDYEGKDMENMGMMDKIKFMKVTAEVGFKSLDIMSKWSDYHNQSDIFKKDLTEDEKVALESVMKRFEVRMKQIEEKHSKFFNEE